ncbi:FadR/GntR family transcriptional regulator [Ovoidimarina sediminis]|uniref:FadR/GntR family transcriptional regulator n=1 Tax=Ovoidimarina sediminis TaxID=3079856 RepID=UPI002912BF74|nr:FCD domain-containing protein [Rhodophyticola sp. MJ-SS7]MDU8944202.1 FCD domain-containing protein [Rhodophyticola sp. MJ-SS7]
MNIVARQESDTRVIEATERLRALIEGGDYRPGDRLPPERDLIQDLGISRTILRKALDSLEREGAIWRHVGKGTFKSSRPSLLSDLSLLSRQVTPVKMVRARLAIEPAIAREAAINASVEAVTRLRLAGERAERARSWEEYEALDDRFHRTLAEATDNILLLALFERLNETRRSVAGTNVIRKSSKPPEGHSSFTEHRDVVAAIEARDPHAAFEAMRRHIGSVSARLFGEV